MKILSYWSMDNIDTITDQAFSLIRGRNVAFGLEKLKELLEKTIQRYNIENVYGIHLTKEQAEEALKMLYMMHVKDYFTTWIKNKIEGGTNGSL